jgi:flavin-dependent thymidylate synthase
MIVDIAGFNIDRTLIEMLNMPLQATPETISAAYARISRSRKNVNDLRQEAISEVEKARQSNEKIVFEMGHSSIAEHAVFNIDIIGISRYLTEYVQKSRLASFTEKSQRYVTWNNEFVTPQELRDSPLEKPYKQQISQLFDLYKELYKKAYNYYEEKLPALAHRNREEMAKEDARYVLPLATTTQMGMTINARSLENLLRRLANMELLEASILYTSLGSQVKKVTPSLIRYVESDPYKKKLKNCFPEFNSNIAEPPDSNPLNRDITILMTDPEERILAGLFFENYPQDFSQLLLKLKKLSTEKKEQLFQRVFSDINIYHQVPKAFELVDCQIQASVSSSCFAQLKRHRLATIIRSGYHPQYGFVIPEIFRKTRSEHLIKESLSALSPLYDKLEDHKRGLGSYLMTNAHKVNVIFKTNLRELYHFSRLRSDKHAQWEIRELSQQIDSRLKQLLPKAARLMMGKDQLSGDEQLKQKSR